MEPVASGSQQPVRAPYSPVSSPDISPIGSHYLLTLSDQHYGDIINDMGHNGLWNIEVMELAPFIALNLPGWEGVTLRIEDQQSHPVLLLPPPEGEASRVLVLRQTQNQHEQLFYSPLLSGHFEAMEDVPYGDHFMMALYAARYNLMPDQVSSLEILRFRQSLADSLHYDGNCQHYINRYFHHWAPRPAIAQAAYRGANDAFETLLHQQGYNLIARGRDVQQQVPFIHEVLNLFNHSLAHTLTTISQSTSRISHIIARQLGILPQQVSGEMLELINQRLTNYYQVVQRYLHEDASQFLLSTPNEQQRGVDAAAYPDDHQHRIVFTTMNQQASFVKLLQTVPHEVSHMMPGEQSTDDMFYLIGYGLPNELRTTTSALNAMSEEQNETSSLEGLADLLLSKIYDAIMMKTHTPAGMSRMRFLEMLDKAKGATLDDARWQAFMQHQQQEYGLPDEWLNATRQEVFNDPVWAIIAHISGLNYRNPAQLLTELHADKLALLKVILQNADSLMMLVLEYDADYLAQYTRLHGYQFIRPNLSSDSFDTESNASTTYEPDYRSLVRPEGLTPFQLHHALEDLAQVSTTLANTPVAAMSDMLAVSPFIIRYGSNIGRHLGYLAAHRSALPGISSTLYLATLSKMRVERLMTPSQILRIILPGEHEIHWSITDAVTDRFCQDGKLLAWQQLVSDCLNALPRTQRHGYLQDFTSSAGGQRFLQNITHQLPVLISTGNQAVIHALRVMVNDGLIPASYQIASDINRLFLYSPALPPPPAASVDIFALLNYVKEFSHVINEEYLSRLNDAGILSGLATQHGWYVVSEDEEGEARYFFDPQGQNVLAQPPQLSDNQLVLVVRNNDLNLLQQTADGPQQMAHINWQPGNNASLIVAAQQIDGAAFQQLPPSLLIRQFLRSMPASAESHPTLLPPAQISPAGGLSALAHTSKIDKNARRINQQLNKYHTDITADNTRFTQHGKKAPLKTIKLALNEMRGSKKRKADEAELQSISSHVEDIEENLLAMQHFTGVDRRLRHFNALPQHFHLIRQHSLNLRSDNGPNKRHKKDRVERQIKQITKSTREGMRYTLKAKGKIHSLSSPASEGKPSRYLASLLHHQASENQQAPRADGFAGVVSDALMALSQPAFSAAQQQDCLMRDRQRQQHWQAGRDIRDNYQRHARQEWDEVTYLTIQLEQALLERKRRVDLTQQRIFIGNPRRDAEGDNHQPEDDVTGANSPATESGCTTSLLTQQTAPPRLRYSSRVGTVTPEIAENAGCLLNINSNFSATRLLAPATVTRREAYPIACNPVRVRRPAYPANSGSANIVRFVDFIRRSEHRAADPQAPLDTLRFSTRRTLPTAASPPSSHFARITPSTVDPVREAHRDMVVHAQRSSLFSAVAAPALLRQQLDRLTVSRRPPANVATQRQTAAEEALRQHRRMVQIATQRRALDLRMPAGKK